LRSALSSHRPDKRERNEQNDQDQCADIDGALGYCPEKADDSNRKAVALALVHEVLRASRCQTQQAAGDDLPYAKTHGSA
jgi:hypothetical protein